ncbi:adenylate/guanylate cyclase domain-containing protein (plasmid) [Rhizobium grahamii]|uniref:Adenylate/guanylate cyclase domain-containing protein n=1 Tax=Rhizobium grahamii TaxID=1120045 RepID=A0A5Q0CHP5_9HYPH|nr:MULTISPECIES: adenylate/guanylate cyclase domain-containing protein [Rhizobium]QFY63881.1 adenylate/guanylate cyclase domain-containing protein [Rhizobium grahamii]QRM52874.1 adenylate/guanylate cyclase domain-containing protein [Rhizobium sp. BG6]
MSEVDVLFATLRQAADPQTVDRIESVVMSGADRDLNRINALAFADAHQLDQEKTIAALLHAARIGAFEMTWNVLCPGCGGVLDTGATLKGVDRETYHCALCAAGYEPTLDEMVEVTFTVSPRVRRIEAHDPDRLSPIEYYRQIFFSSGVDLPEDFEAKFSRSLLELIELAPGEKAFLSLQLPAQFVIIFDAVTHSARFLDVKGDATSERQNLSMVISQGHAVNETLELRPGLLRLTLENHTDRRVVPNVCVAGDDLHEILGRRRPFLTAKRLLTNQSFRDIYRTDTLDVDQRLKITSLTFLFTDLRGSTALYERVGDLAAFDLVRAHFRVLHEIVAAEAGAVVKTIGDAVMATFPTPDRAVAAALRMREAMLRLNTEHGSDDLLLKIGIHEGPCLAVNLNDRQDYFGQTVNIASRVQGLADPNVIMTTEAIVGDAHVSEILRHSGIASVSRMEELQGIAREVRIFALS